MKILCHECLQETLPLEVYVTPNIKEIRCGECNARLARTKVKEVSE